MRNQLILAAAAVPSLRVADVEYNTEQIIRLIAENSRFLPVLYASIWFRTFPFCRIRNERISGTGKEVRPRSGGTFLYQIFRTAV